LVPAGPIFHRLPNPHACIRQSRIHASILPSLSPFCPPPPHPTSLIPLPSFSQRGRICPSSGSGGEAWARGRGVRGAAAWSPGLCARGRYGQGRSRSGGRFVRRNGQAGTANSRSGTGPMMTRPLLQQEQAVALWPPGGAHCRASPSTLPSSPCDAHTFNFIVADGYGGGVTEHQRSSSMDGATISAI
ncbi:unnamed protein product, partial [Urochloa humidicola]